MRVATGEYRIDYYDHYGARIKGLEESCVTYTQALERGVDLRDKDDDIQSFSVCRILYNSLDKENNKW